MGQPFRNVFVYGCYKKERDFYRFLNSNLLRKGEIYAIVTSNKYHWEPLPAVVSAPDSCTETFIFRLGLHLRKRRHNGPAGLPGRRKE